MSAKAFFDSNILVYLYDQSHTEKSDAALQLFRTTSSEGRAVISYQVVHEFINVALKKSQPPLELRLLQSVTTDLFGSCDIVLSSTALVESALHLHFQSHFHWYDCLILAAAIEARCSILYTEDLQDGQRFGELVVKNPFQA